MARIRVPDLDLFRPLAREVATFAESLNTARSAAELEARLRESGESIWTADRLAVHVRARLEDGRLFVVSNREPYIHLRRGKTVEVNQPASGLVTALEPVLRACGGTWVAHGSRRRRYRCRGSTTIACWFLPTIRTTRCAGSGCRKRKSRATTTASRTRDCGRSATSPTRARCFALTTGSTTRKSTAVCRRRAGRNGGH